MYEKNRNNKLLEYQFCNFFVLKLLEKKNIQDKYVIFELTFSILNDHFILSSFILSFFLT